MSTRMSLTVVLTLVLSAVLIVAAVAAIVVAEPVSGLMQLVFAGVLLNALLAVPPLAWHIAPYLNATLRQQLETKRRLQSSRPQRTIALP